MNIYIVVAESAHVPGLIIKPFATLELADVEAASIVNTILNGDMKHYPGDFEVELPEPATAQTWKETLAALVEIEDDVDCTNGCHPSCYIFEAPLVA